MAANVRSQGVQSFTVSACKIMAIVVQNAGVSKSAALTSEKKLKRGKMPLRKS